MDFGRSKTSDSIKALVEALVAVQSEIQPAIKSRENSHLRSKYADLAAVTEACRTALTKHRFAVLQLPFPSDAGVGVTTILTHASGEWISSDLEMPLEKRSPQAVGSAITYARRYALAAMVGVVVDDDDGEDAMGRGSKHDPPARPQKAAPASTDPEKDLKEVLDTLAAAKTPDALDAASALAGKLIPKGHRFREQVAKAFTAKRSEIKGAA